MKRTAALTGAWKQAEQMLASAPTRVRLAAQTALRREAERLRAGIVDGLTSQSPGGEDLDPPSALTLAKRKVRNTAGHLSLVVHGDLRNGIQVKGKGLSVFVGVLRRTRARDGESLVDIASMNEFGSDPIVIPVTPGMRRFWALLFAEAGDEGRAQDATDDGADADASKEAIVVQIPARPFLRPAYEAFAARAPTRFASEVAMLLWSARP